MFEGLTAGHDDVGINLRPTDELLLTPDTAYLLPIIGAEVVEATNWVAPSGSPDGGAEKFFFVDPDRDK